MKETKIYCDHCGKELNTMKDYEELKIDMGYKWKTVDLCVECFDELYDTVFILFPQNRTTKKGANNERN